MEIREILRQLRSGESDRSIGRNLRIHRKTVKKYRAWAEQQGYLEGELPTLEIVQAQVSEDFVPQAPPRQVSSVAPYRAQIEAWQQQGVRISAMYARLQEQGFAGSYAAVQRFVRQLAPRPVEVSVRVERAAGEEAQVDFGYAGWMLDEQGKRRKTWAFVMTLSYSRHQYVEFVFDQRVETWLELHRHAFEFFGGVPRRLVTDNLKAAIVRACWEGCDPQVQRAYWECAEHYGFIIAPCRPYTPQHKGKVERGVGYVKSNFLGGRGEMRLSQANAEVQQWCLGKAGQRVHGTSKRQPLACFEGEERQHLGKLPTVAYEYATWKTVKLHRDGYIVFENAYYSAPFRYVGQPLLVRGTRREVKLYTPDYQLITTHSRASTPGERVTLLDHLPPYKVDGVLWNEALALARATEIGSATTQTVQQMLQERVLDPLPKAKRLLALAQRTGPTRLEAACQRALAYGDPTYATVKRILTQGLEDQAHLTLPYRAGDATLFARPVHELVGAALQEVGTWQ